MKVNSLIKILIYQLLFIGSLTAQNPSDCISAIEVCDDSDLAISFQNPNGFVNESIVNFCGDDDSIIPIETNVVWVKYSFSEGGDFVFDIIPDTNSIDIDFLVFRPKMNNCDSLEGIRCMYSGENVATNDDSLCLGSTGLSFNSTDFSEYPGCAVEDDNYLAPLEIEAGDVIYLLISVFSGAHDYTIKHGGSAEISCNPVSNKEEYVESAITFFPNPIRDYLKIEWSDHSILSKQMVIMNPEGKEMVFGQIQSGDDISLAHLPSGIYFVILSDNDDNHFSKMITKF